MGRKLLLGVLAVIVVLVVVISTCPSGFHIERSVMTSAPAESAFAQVNDFHSWAAWSPWEKMDPTMKKSFEGAPAGAGAIYAWTGNDKVGEGRMTIEKADKPSLVSIKLEFLKPWTATNTATFTFAPSAGGTKVTWAMDGDNNFMAKAAGMFMNMDKMIGGDFERGLAALKTAAESAAPVNAEALKAAP